MNPEQPRRKPFIRIGIILAVIATLAVIAAQFLSGPSSGDSAAPATGAAVWTCSMHPQVRLPKPGKCPICSMPLVPAPSFAKATAGAKASGESMLTLSDHARAMASVEDARGEYNRSFPRVAAMPEQAAASPEAGYTPDYAGGDGKDFIGWLKIGFAFSLPLIVLGLIALVVIASRMPGK